MGESPLDVLKRRFRLHHRWILKSVEELTEEQFRWRPTGTAHSIAFELWHVARSNDHMQAKVTSLVPALAERAGASRQIWHAEGLAARWGLDPATLGWEEVGTGMDDAVAATLPLPAKEVLLDYARRAFDASERVAEMLDDETFQIRVGPALPFETDRPLGEYLVEHYAHDDWAWGYISALRRAQGLARTIA